MNKRKDACSKRLQRRDKIKLCKVLCVALQLGVMVIGWQMLQSGYDVFAQTSIMLTAIYALITIWLHNIYGSLYVGNHKVSTLCAGQLLTLGISDFMLTLLAALTMRRMPDLCVLSGVFVVQVLIGMIWCLVVNKYYFAITPAASTLVIYGSQAHRDSLAEVFRLPEKYDIRIERCVDAYDADPALLESDLKQTATVFLSGVDGWVREQILRNSASTGRRVFIRPDLCDVVVSNTVRRYIAHTPMLMTAPVSQGAMYRVCKRTMDIVCSGLALLVLSPVLGVVALLIHREDKGPVLYRQQRLTRGGRTFDIVKFRSMRVDAEKDGVARLASENDDRITCIGKVIRATRLDELPQLWNILKGDMSIVGPRPERPEIAARYEAELPEFKARLLVKAGLTGYAQVHGKYNSTPEDKLQMDLMYISDMSIMMDLRLILQTIQIIFHKDSTEGVQQGKTTAAD